MNAIIEFFTTLFTHRAMLRREIMVRNEVSENLIHLHEKRKELEAAILTLSHALVYITTPPPEPEPSVLKPVRFQRVSYAEAQQRFERANSARFRDMDAERTRKAQGTNR